MTQFFDALRLLSKVAIASAAEDADLNYLGLIQLHVTMLGSIHVQNYVPAA